ncbi:SRPBCC family protein [Streptomyces sp. AK02-01A]|uniref:SRPBCC family protein n=1 Tax=Streptomyces sp. AK02-01A TaxID=3028648 RepID=UPI0029AE0DD5|nr:SRPBCC family protein [Streptomyces sp. AK02-01A]MDX3849646.1 SRPBCC family protein [Streptomyces sp. AK02-01A]MDX3849784.1 SRPBCC family protein [Streptomyces sp. AK02-01A]
MRIDNEFTVGVPIDEAWEALTDLEGIAPCMPGAHLTGVDGAVCSGEVEIKVGPVISQYAGTAQLVEKDEAAHRAVIRAKGSDSRGAGNATALINAELRPEGAATVVTVATDLDVTGEIAQFGSGMIKEVSVRLVDRFVENLEAELHPLTTPDHGPGISSDAASEPGPVVGTGMLSGMASPAPGGTGEVRSPGAAASSGTPEADGTSQVPTPHHPGQRQQVEPLDLMSLAGTSIYRRSIPIIAGALVVAALIVYFLVH